MSKIAIIGTTSWGTTLGIKLARKAKQVRLWARNKDDAEKAINPDKNPALLPGTTLPPRLSVTTDLSQAMDDVEAVILVVPSQTMRQNVKLIAPYLKDSMLIISAAKGLEVDSSERMSQVIAEEIEPKFHHNICVLSGPNLSLEILKGLPAASVVAAESEATAKTAQKLLTAPNFCVFTNTDVIGVELGGALKNIIALGAGIADGLGYGDNAKSAFITRGLTEMTALGAALGANPLTFSGLAGLGDLIATCSSPLSRNHFVGVELTKNRSLKEITDSMDGVAEGVGATLVAWKLARKMGLAMPITEKIYQVLYRNVDLRKAVSELLAAEVKHELSGRKWKLVSFFRRKPRLSKNVS
jgi:glycerol-3-phosphate dehydrogenase (NAD(P)+)